MRVLIAAGGTGGHIYPGIAVARELMQTVPGSEVRFVGTSKGLENKLVPNAGFRLERIESAGLVNMGLAARLKGLMILPKSFADARRLIRSFKPDVVVGAGGYVSGPVLLTAHFMGYPTLIMESNAVPGFTNRKLARWVDRAAASFESALPYFRGKGVVTGNPVRHEFFEVAQTPLDPGNFRILVFGGSQGARAINKAVIAALPLLESCKDRLHITHQTGDADFETVTAGYSGQGWSSQVEVLRYIDDMVTRFSDANLIVSRAGATSSAELMAAGKAAIIVPLPGQMEQQRNAETMQAAGAARMILQPALSGESLAAEILRLVNSPDLIPEMEAASRRGGRRDAARVTVDLIKDLAGNQAQ